MAKKAIYALSMENGTKPEVKGEVLPSRPSFGIHKREDKMFVITHIPSGMHVVSADKKKQLVELLDNEEFAMPCWAKSAEISVTDVNRLSKIIGEFYSKKQVKKC